MSPIPARRRLLIAAARAATGAALYAGVPAMRTVVAGVPVVRPDRGGIVALAFDRIGGTLIKAGVDALFRSADDGRHWTPVALVPAPRWRRITSIALSAGATGSLYVAATGRGVMRSDDGGRHWSPRNQGLPSRDVAALATHADRAQTVYAYVAGHGILRSEDGGQRWRLMDAGPRGGITRFLHSNMLGSMQSGWLFAATAQGVQRSMDCFCVKTLWTPEQRRFQREERRLEPFPPEAR